MNAELKSIWDGWEKQCFGALSDGKGAYCAVGWLHRNDLSGRSGLPREADASFNRVCRYIRAAYPAVSYSEIVYANNVLRLTPEQFREIDRLTQIQEGMAQVQALVDEVPEPALSEIGDPC